MTGWIGVDLDGTLAHYDGWKGAEHIGEPVPLMVERVKQWLAEGKDVRIFTARMSVSDAFQRAQIEDMIMAWTKKHIGEYLSVTNVKDYGMIQLYDDRCVQVEANTGKLIHNS